jgi:hypothetical protein
MKPNYRAIQDPISTQWVIQQRKSFGRWEDVAHRNTMKEASDLIDRLQSPVVLYPRVMK